MVRVSKGPVGRSDVLFSKFVQEGFDLLCWCADLILVKLMPVRSITREDQSFGSLRRGGDCPFRLTDSFFRSRLTSNFDGFLRNGFLDVDLSVRIDVRFDDVDFASIPGHVGMDPSVEGDGFARGREFGRSVEIVSRGDGRKSARIGRDEDDRVDDFGGIGLRVVFKDGEDQGRVGRVRLEVGETENVAFCDGVVSMRSDRGASRLTRSDLLGFSPALVASRDLISSTFEIAENDTLSVTRKSPTSSSILVYSRANIPLRLIGKDFLLI